MTNKDLSDTEKGHYFSQEFLSRWIGYFLVVGMMVCLGSTISMLLANFVFYSTGYMPVIGGLAAIEGLITQSRMRRTADMYLSPAAYMIVEWVVIALVLRGLMYFWLGWNTFLQDLAGVRTSSVMSFINGTFVFAMLVALLAWVLARMYAEDLKDLSEDKVLLMIREGEIESNRALIRKRITGRVMAVGFGLVLLTAFSNLDSGSFSWDMFQGKNGSINLIVYFVMGLLLMSLAHFAALRAAWAWERIPIDASIGQRWVINSLLLLVIIGFISFLLPAKYSIGLFEAISYIIYIFTFLVYGIFTLIQLPIFAVITLLSRIFRTQTPQFIQNIPTPPPPPAETTPVNIPEWSLILRSILFWAILVTLIVFAVIQFFRQNQEILQAVGKKRGWRLILQAFSWLRERITGLRSAVSTMVENGAQLFGNMVRRNRQGEPWNYISLRNLTPQQKVRFYYLALIRRSSEVGIKRKDHETPYEYAQTLTKAVGEEQENLDALTKAFVEARYSDHTITPGQVGRVRQAWDHLRRVLKGKKNDKTG